MTKYKYKRNGEISEEEDLSDSEFKELLRQLKTNAFISGFVCYLPEKDTLGDPDVPVLEMEDGICFIGIDSEDDPATFVLHGYDSYYISPSRFKFLIDIIHRRARGEPIFGSQNTISLKLRFKVFKRDNFKCQYCGRSSKDGAILEIDHIIPKSKGGTDDMDNLITSCKECNRGKSAELLDE